MCNYAIISNNCWGSSFYQDNNIQYNTPFAGLFLYPDDYISLISNFRKIIKQPLRIVKKSRYCETNYPVACIDEDIEIHFLHYRSSEDAFEKWYRRIARLPIDNDHLYLKICDREGFRQNHLDAFVSLNYKYKFAYLKKGSFNTKGIDWISELDTDGQTVPDGMKLWEITKSEFIQNTNLHQKIFSHD